MKCEYRTEPLGIDSPTPRLSWIVESGLRDQAQSAYQVLPDGTGPDSCDISPALFGKKGFAPIREAIISHSENGTFAIRRAVWKLVVDNKTSGGWMTPAGKSPVPGTPGLLYNLADDPYEQNDLREKRRDVVERLTALLEKYIAEAWSTPRGRRPRT